MSGLIDTTRPDPARVHNYWLNGKENFRADREMGEKIASIYPGIRDLVRKDRDFTLKACRWAATIAGIRQFIDLGCGLPQERPLHRAVQDAAWDSVVAYVDNNPLVLLHAPALLAAPGVVTVDADIADPEAVLGDEHLEAVIDLGQPVCVILAAILHFRPAGDAALIVRDYAKRLAPGSAVLLSVAHYEDAELARHLSAAYKDAGGWYNHGVADVAGWFAGAGLRLFPETPGDVSGWPFAVPARRWREACIIGGLGLKD